MSEAQLRWLGLCQYYPTKRSPAFQRLGFCPDKISFLKKKKKIVINQQQGLNVCQTPQTTQSTEQSASIAAVSVLLHCEEKRGGDVGEGSAFLCRKAADFLPGPPLNLPHPGRGRVARAQACPNHHLTPNQEGL